METEVKEEVSTEPKDDFVPPTTEELFSLPTANSKVEEKETPVEPVVEATPEDTEQEQPEEPTEEVVEEAVNWDTEENPWKTKAESFEKRYNDATAWGNRAHMKLKELGFDDYQNEMKAEEEVKEALYKEREKASYPAAVKLYGKDKVQEELLGENSKFSKIMSENPNLWARVKESESPYFEAMDIVNEYEFFGEWGRDTTKIVEKIKKKYEGELREKITKEFQKKLSKKEELPKTLSGVKSADKPPESTGFTPPSTKEIFG